MQDADSFLHKPKVIILDVYQTLLDMSEAQRKVNNVLDSSKGYTLWFEVFLQYMFVDNCMGRFNSFSSIAKATMQMVAHKLGKAVDDADVEQVLEMLRHLPVHDGVQEGLSELNDAGLRIAALTNSSERVVCERMERTGLISYFEMVLSAEEKKQYKPCLDVYRWAANKLRVEPKDCLLVSAHGWDLAGAAAAGMQTAFLKQDGQMPYPLAPQPQFVCKTLLELASQLQALV